MDPELALENQQNANALLAAMKTVAQGRQDPAARQAMLDAAGVDIGVINLYADPMTFAISLVALFRKRLLTARNVEQHPMVLLLDFLIETGPTMFGLEDASKELFKRLVFHARENGRVLAAREAVGRIENDRGDGIGTGVLVGNDLLLTCIHVLTKTRVKSASVRFGNKRNADGHSVAPGTRYTLDLKAIVHGGGPQPDYALLRIGGSPGTTPRPLSAVELNSGNQIRMIHHPLGAPATISGPGTITHSAEDYILHTLAGEEGSSGAPIFNHDWELVALHRGYSERVAEGTSEGVPIDAFREVLEKHLH